MTEGGDLYFNVDSVLCGVYQITITKMSPLTAKVNRYFIECVENKKHINGI